MKTSHELYKEFQKLMAPAGPITDLKIEGDKLIITHESVIPEYFQITAKGMEIEAVVYDMLLAKRKQALDEAMECVEKEILKYDIESRDHVIQQVIAALKNLQDEL